MNETMRSEILAQPEEVRRAIPILRREIAKLELTRSNRVLAGGCGDSFFASQTAAGFFSPASNYRPATALDICHYTHIRAQDFCILISISGSTRRTVDAAIAARRAGSRTLAITCGAQSVLARSCDGILLLPFTPTSRRNPHTLDYTMTVVALAVIGEHFAGQPFRWIDELPNAIEKAIFRADKDCLAVGSDAREGTRWFFLGSGPGLGIASYGAAKFHEAGGLPSWSGELENFMHGMNFMLEPNDRVCVVAHDLPSWKYASRVGNSLHAIGVRPWFVLPGGEILADPGSQSSTATTALVTCAMPLQLMCLEHANRLGLFLEAPRAGRRDGELYIHAQKLYFGP